MRATKANLPLALEELERALSPSAGSDGQDRTAQLAEALADLEEAARRHIRAMESPDGLIGKMDRPRLPSPAVDRGTDQLRAELESFLQDIQALRARAQMGTLPEHSAFFQRARQLAAELERHQAREACLVLETVNLDLGAGD
jgi:hypothetical protein